MLELKEIRNNLNNVSAINNLDIKRLSYRNIDYDISYYGDLKILLNLFKLNKLNIIYDKDLCIIRLI
tara:strand:+ start:63 stop:263 length:201 start_codon:yes stop_codon:yes gene_type:complete